MYKAALVLTVSVVMFIFAVQTTDVQQQKSTRKIASPTKTPTTLSDVVNLLMNLEKRCVLKN